MHQVKTPAGTHRTFALALAGALIAATAVLGACAQPGVRPAPFRARPDAVAAGSLVGPFDGRVLDGESDRPVAGAQVYAVWTFVGGYAFTGPAGSKQWIGTTDASGRYRVPALDLDVVPDGARVAAFRLVVFKRGFVAWRSDRRFDDGRPRHDFAQKQSEIRLERWRSEISHVAHLRYVGGGATLGELTRWELPEAVAELSGEARPSGGPGGAGGGGVVAGTDPQKPEAGPPLPAERLLLPADVAEVTGFAGEFDVGDLGDEPPSPRYNSVHLRAKNQPEAFDVAARIWRVGADAEVLFGKLVDELPGVKETQELGDKSLRAVSDAGDIIGFAYLDKSRGLVVLIQCGASQCRSGDQAMAIAQRVKDRAEALWPAGGGK